MSWLFERNSPPERAGALAMPILWQLSRRFLLRRARQSGLMVLGIALGVAMVVAIDLANVSASRAFELSTETLTGRATHHIFGGSQGIEEQVFVSLYRSGLVAQATPIINTLVFSPQLGNQPLQLVGIDPFSDAPFRGYLDDSLQANELLAFLTRPGAILLPVELGERYHLPAGSVLTVEMNGYERQVFVAGWARPSQGLARRTISGILLADVATVQELAMRQGWLDRIDLILPKDDQRVLKKLENWLPPGYRLESVEAQQGLLEQMTAAFRLNLSALSLLALAVGLFLIYNTMTFSVVQRRSLLGTLRCLGVTRREIFAMVAGEALLVGLVGGCLGIGLGVLMGRQTVRMVTQTINDLYFAVSAQGVALPVESLIKGLALGLLATLLAAFVPAWEAASVPPRVALARSVLESKTRRSVLWIAVSGIGLVAAGGALFLLPYQELFFGFGGLLVLVIGLAVLAIPTLVGLSKAVSPLLGLLQGFLGRIAARGLVNALSRTAVAVAALMVAVAVTVSVTLMIDSFRYTVGLWLEANLQADVYISVPYIGGTVPFTPIDPQVLPVLQGWPGVRRVDLQRSLQVDTRSGSVILSATTNYTVVGERLFRRPPEGSPQEVWQAMQQGTVLVSEPLARRFNLPETGNRIDLFTSRGWQSFPVGGVFYDYTSSQGVVLMAKEVYQREWGDPSFSAIGLRLEPGVDAERVAADLRDALSTGQRLLIRPNQTLRRDILTVFDRTFAITGALRILATVVAFIGVLNTLLLLQMEKQRELGILRAVGLTGRQLWRLVMIESGLMGLVAGLLAVPTGCILALVLIYIINQRSFGWTLQLDLQPAAFLQALVLAVGAALLAGIYPAWKLGRMAAADAIRYE